jgi:hypothetical protein
MNGPGTRYTTADALRRPGRAPAVGATDWPR